MMASSASLLTTTGAGTSSKPLISSGNNTPKATISCELRPACSSSNATATNSRRELLVAGTTASVLALQQLLILPSARAGSDDEEYVRDTTEVIAKLRATVNMAKNDPGVAEAVADLREASNAWVAKFRREKALLGRASFRDIYSALNAVSGHYVSFGPTAPIPAKRKARILEEVDTAEKSLQRGR